MEHCGTVKNNEEVLCRLLWEYFKDALLSRKKIKQGIEQCGLARCMLKIVPKSVYIFVLAVAGIKTLWSDKKLLIMKPVGEG